VNWIGEFNSRERDSEFKGLTILILEIIKSKEEYKALPPVSGYYQ
jgi:hypothetical protein